MLFTPKKYGKDWTRFLGISFCVASLGFGLAAAGAVFGQFDNLTDRIFAISAFTAAAIIFGALGRDKCREASKMPQG
jgi:hypothetical protein